MLLCERGEIALDVGEATPIEDIPIAYLMRDEISLLNNVSGKEDAQERIYDASLESSGVIEKSKVKSQNIGKSIFNFIQIE